MSLDPRACYRALRARDVRSDGRFFIGVKTTGIYCRPVCPAGLARFENCVFFPTAAAAQSEGYRPCLRCRPETVAHLGAWRGTSNTVARALRLLASLPPDADGAGLDQLAERVGVSDRQLRRLFRQHLGAAPIAVLQTRRVLFAKQLLHETNLPMSEVASASGFGSVRRFNHLFRSLFHRPPTAIRRESGGATDDGAGVTVRLRYRAPYDWDSMLAHLRTRALDGLEAVTADGYRRLLERDGAQVIVLVRHEPKRASLAVTFRGAAVLSLSGLVETVRRVFDLDADVSAIGAHLSKDPLLAPLVRARPGLRVPGAWDGFEAAVRTVLGQQVTVEAGRRLANTLVSACGGVALTPTRVLAAPLEQLRMPAARRQALTALARAALADPTVFDAASSLEETVAKLCAIRGVGEWTAQLVALRAAREPDAFPAGDAVLLRRGMTEEKLLARAEAWRPWRGYAAQHLWLAERTR